MSRLIDADELLRTFTVNSDGQRIPEKDCDNFDLTISLKDIKRIIREQPTAYDLDKVVEQLENRSTLARPVGWSKAYEIIMLKDAIEIVKGGGVE
jgi:hypothetical protein